MTYANPFLMDFLPVFFGVIEAKKIDPKLLEVIVWDEELQRDHIFERVDVKDVLYQLGPQVNALTIYTDRPEYFKEFVRQMDDEQGLIVEMWPKERRRNGILVKTGYKMGVVLDFEWKGADLLLKSGGTCVCIPIHKKPWKVAENLDIVVPFGYNTVIVKSKYTNDKKFVNDRFEEGFYRDELFYKEG